MKTDPYSKYFVPADAGNFSPADICNFQPYSRPFFITGKVSNNVFSFEKRPNPKLYVPDLIEGNMPAVVPGKKICFEDLDENGVLKSCAGLEHFVKLKGGATGLSEPVYIFDNHNHSFYFWHLEKLNGNLNNGALLIHVDQHKDCRMPETFLNEAACASGNISEIFEYTNTVLNVGNFIPAAQKSGLAGEVLNVDSSEALMKIDSNLNALRALRPARSMILDIDLDFFAPEMDYINNELKITMIKKLMPLAGVVTIATSPFFIEQQLALHWLKKIFE